MIKSIKKLWEIYEINFHLGYIKRNYKHLPLHWKIIAKLFQAYYWILNAGFSIALFPLELFLISMMELEQKQQVSEKAMNGIKSLFEERT